MKHLFLFAVAFPLLAFGQVGSINVPLMLGTNAVPVSHPGFFDTNAAAIASAVAPVISLDAGRITSGVLPISRIATGTPTGTKFVRDDGTLATPAGGGGGSNFITSVSADFQVLLEALSLTNATGTGQLLRASTLSPYLLSATASTLYQPLDPDLSDLADGSLTGSKVGPGIDAGNITTGTLGDARIPATIARLDSPQFTGTVGFEFLQADTVQVPWASRYATANGSSNLVGTLDGGSWTNLNGTEIRSGTVAAARIDSVIARTDSPNFTGNPTVPTASPGDNDTSAASTAFVTAAVTAGGGGGGDALTTNPLSQFAATTSSQLAGVISDETGTGASVFAGSPALTGSPTVGGTNLMNYVAGHLTEAEASALYHGTNSTLTRVAGIGSGTTGDIIYRDATGWTNLAKGTQGQYLAVTATVPAWSNAPSGGGTWDGTPIASGAITNLTTSSIALEGFTKTNALSGAFSDYEPISVEFINGASVSTTGGLPWFSGTAISSGTSAVVTDETNRLGIVSMSSAAGANSGWYYMTLNNTMFAQVGMTWESATKVQNTNAGARTSIGFHDVFNLNNPIDAIRVFRSNDTVYGQVWNSTTLTQTSGSANVSSNQWLDVKIQIVATNQVAFDVWNGNTGASLLSETLTADLPRTSARVFGMGILTVYTNAAAVPLEYVDKIKFSMNKPVTR